MTSKIPERYKKMQDKIKLPQLKELRETFRFDVENNDEIFDQIRIEVSDRIFSFTERIIEPIITGSDSLCCMFEENMLTNEERSKMFDLYKKIQVLKWENNILMIKPNDKDMAKWINKTWIFWNDELGTELSTICKKLSMSWDDLKFKDVKTDYHG